MGCGMLMVKYILFLFNLLCALGGAATIGVAAYIMTKLSKTEDVDDEYYIGVILIVLGSIIFLVAFFGCCGAIRESYCMSITYAILLFILLLLQVGVILFVHSLEKDIEISSKKLVESAWENRISDPDDMDNLQIEHKCCGNKSPHDYKIHGFGGFFPASCCLPNIESCTESTMHNIGCQDAQLLVVKKHWENVKYGCIGIAALEFAGIVSTGCLLNNIRNIRRRNKY